MCAVLVSVAGKSCNAAVELNCVSIIPFINEWEKNVCLGLQSRVPVYPKYTIIKVTTEKVHCAYSINEWVPLCLDSHTSLSYFSLIGEIL